MADPTDREDEIERRVSRLFPVNPDCEHSADMLEVCVDCVASALRDVAQECVEIVLESVSDEDAAAAIRKRFGINDKE